MPGKNREQRSKDKAIKAADEMMPPVQVSTKVVYTELNTWNRQFKAAIKNDAAPKEDLPTGLCNDFDKNEW